MRREKAAPEGSPSSWWSSSASRAQRAPRGMSPPGHPMAPPPGGGLGASRRRTLVRSERVLDGTAAFHQMPLLVPEAPERGCEPHDTVGFADRLEPVHRSTQVV